MPEPSASFPAIYQLRVVLRGVSPLVWRLLLVASNTSLAELHEVLQHAFAWSDDHLHRFLIHGAAYGVPRLGGCRLQVNRRLLHINCRPLRPFIWSTIKMQKHRSRQGASEMEWQETCPREAAIRSLIEAGTVIRARADVFAKDCAHDRANEPSICPPKDCKWSTILAAKWRFSLQFNCKNPARK